MSDPLKHECGIGLIRLLKPLDFYYNKYGQMLYGLNKLYLLMEKQHNRGQDGAGIASVKINHPAGKPYISRMRSIDSSALKDIYSTLHMQLNDLKIAHPDIMDNVDICREFFPMAGDIFMGHLRYGTHGENSINSCHPFERKSNWRSKDLLLSGNFNLTNVDEIIQILIDAGQHPKDSKDTITIMENIGYHLDEENDFLYHKYKEEGYTKAEISQKIAAEMDICKVLNNASKRWDGGFAIQGVFGHGDSFVMRDKNGIRPAYYYFNDELAVVASERSAIATVFACPLDEIKEIPPAHALIIKHFGKISIEQYTEMAEKKSCSFERIYFSRGSDKAIYDERKALGRALVPQVLKSIDNDLDHTVFSYIPNTAEIAFMGMVEELNSFLNREKSKYILDCMKNNSCSRESIEEILNKKIRIEKAAIKDVKLRTFIADDKNRDELVAHVYDTTHHILNERMDYLCVIDDSIVRGTTLRDSILKILSRLSPKKIIIVSSAPQIRYPDCYGIDMSRSSSLIAFQAAIALLKERGRTNDIDQIYRLCKNELNKKKEDMHNHVNKLFEPFSDEDISKKIAELLYKEEFNCEIELIFQTVENLHQACPNHLGDWYFTGKFPTPGGTRVALRSFVNYYENSDARAY